MKKLKFQNVVFIVLLLIGNVFTIQAQDATSILKKMDDVMYSSKDMTGVNKIVLIDKNGRESSREATIAQKGTDKRLFRFTRPASQAGISVLSLPNDVMYLYMPAFGKERRISSSVKNQKFAGTDFSYDDMESKLFTEKYSPKMVKTDDQAYILNLIPKSKRSAYSKVIISINKQHYYPIKMEYFDKGNRKIKVADYTFKKIGKYWNASQIVMKDLKRNHTTKMIMSNVKYDSGLTDNDFTVRKLQE